MLGKLHPRLQLFSIAGFFVLWVAYDFAPISWQRFMPCIILGWFVACVVDEWRYPYRVVPPVRKDGPMFPT